MTDEFLCQTIVGQRFLPFRHLNFYNLVVSVAAAINIKYCRFCCFLAVVIQYNSPLISF